MKKSILFLFILLFSGVDAQYSSDFLKNTFVIKFIHFVEWPTNYFSKKDSFTLVLFSQKEISEKSFYNFARNKLKGKSVKIIKTSSLSDLKNVEAIYVYKDQKSKLNTIAKMFQGQPTLIISNSNNSTKANYHINLYITPNSTIGFNINPKLLLKSNLTPDIGLLENGNIVKN